MSKELKASREKYWSEIDEKEKAERLRSEVKKLQKSLNTALKRLGQLEEHSHLPSGLLATPLRKHYQEENYGTRRLKGDDEVYF